ncbi:hypothetical protein ARMGADRAFT_1040631 [Armillaria gallica]|uniref:Uncharacterized protein n=1 Tax=Armillaria gallica TaxID=47427 RepID=A0A2H3C993_ARMGA|nr:hypothetical protein ARMGADRAFT_1040631 [Armillaria gallica]
MVFNVSPPQLWYSLAGPPRDISPFLSLHKVISGFSGTMLLSLSEHMAIIIVLRFTSKSSLLEGVSLLFGLSVKPALLPCHGHDTGSESAGDCTMPNILMPNVSMVFHLNSMTPREYAFTFRFIINLTTGTVTMETPERPTSPVTPVAPMSFNLLHANPVSDNKQGQQYHQSNKYEHDSTNSSIQVMLETETESLPPQQLLELLPTQSDLDYKQYWEEQCRMRDNQNKHNDYTAQPFNFSLDSPVQHVQQCKDVEVQPMGAHSTAINLSLILNPQFIWESAHALLKQTNDIYEMDQEKYGDPAQSGIKTVELVTTNLPLWVHQINELVPKVSIAQGEEGRPAKC